VRRHLILVALAACGSRTPPPAPQPTAALDAGVAVADAAPSVAIACVAGSPRADHNPYDVLGVLAAADGDHRDTCDARGDLISFQCELRDRVCPGGGGRDRHMTAPCYEQTGAVTHERVACDGHCRDGACPARCPAFGDRLTYREVGTAVVFDSAADPRRIACALGFDQRDAHDCAADPRAGDRFVVEGLGLSGSACTGGAWGAISDARCTYTDCRYVD